jgi:hypothetical protein
MTAGELGALAWSVAVAVLPLAGLFLLFQSLFLKLPRREVSRILTGTIIAAAGLFLFLMGVGIGFMPFGRAIGEAVGALPQKWLLVPFGLVLGFVTTWGEPSVRILADQVEDARWCSGPSVWGWRWRSQPACCASPLAFRCSISSCRAMGW